MPRLPVGKRHEPAIAASDMMGVGFSALGCMTPFSGTRNGTKQGEGRCRGKLPIMRLNGLSKCSATSVGTSGWQCQRRREGRHLAERELRQVIFDKAYRPGGEHESFWAPPPFQDAHQHAPLQYQKQLRLQEARRLMLVEAMDASAAAYHVGYVSRSQFTREYSRLFGAPPLRDVEQILQQPQPAEL
jgi:hypothetical protein